MKMLIRLLLAALVLLFVVGQCQSQDLTLKITEKSDTSLVLEMIAPKEHYDLYGHLYYYDGVVFCSNQAQVDLFIKDASCNNIRWTSIFREKSNKRRYLNYGQNVIATYEQVNTK